MRELVSRRLVKLGLVRTSEMHADAPPRQARARAHVGDARGLPHEDRRPRHVQPVPLRADEPQGGRLRVICPIPCARIGADRFIQFQPAQGVCASPSATQRQAGNCDIAERGGVASVTRAPYPLMSRNIALVAHYTCSDRLRSGQLHPRRRPPPSSNRRARRRPPPRRPPPSSDRTPSPAPPRRAPPPSPSRAWRR